MNSFYDLVDSLEVLGYYAEETDDIFSISFNYNKKLTSFIEYSYLSKLKNMFSECMNLYISSSINNEIDIFEFLEDEDELEDELRSIRINSSKFKLILNKEAFIKKKFGTLKNSNLIFFVNESSVLKYLDKDIYELENKIFNKDKKNTFVLGNSKTFLKNDYLMISNMQRENFAIEISDFDESPPNINTKKIISIRNELCNWINGTKWLCPDYIYFDFKNSNFIFSQKLRNMLLKYCVNISTAFIANYTNVDEQTGMLFSNINGSKKITVEYKNDVEYDIEMVKYIFQQYKWVYESNNSDKIGILRNTISMFLCDECKYSCYELMINKAADIYYSTCKTFDNYLNGKVKEYFEEQHKFREMLSNKCKDITNEIESIIETMNKNFLTSIGVILAGAIGYVAKSNIYILKVSIILYGLFMLANAIFYIPFYKLKVDEIISDYSEHVKTFKKFLGEKGIPDDKRIINIKKKFQIYWKRLIWINILLVLSSFLGAFYTKQIVDIIKKVI